MMASLVLLLACAAVQPTVVSPPSAPTRVELLAASLPGVVLLVKQNPDATIGFGSGVWLEDGTVLTNLHVVSGGTWIGAMAYRANRPSYIPADGGIPRYLFENQAELHHAELVRGDPILDLALVRVDGLVPTVVLPWRSEPVVAGESVYALGHPNQVVWSFTTGVVSALHQGAVQTDAPINRGNSGGPLVDERGRIVGINTTKLFGDSEGIAFARPVDLVREFINAATAPIPMDRSNPRSAWSSCQRAFELGLPGQRDCIAWESVELQAERALTTRLAEPKWRARFPRTASAADLVTSDWLVGAFEDALNRGYRELTGMLGGWTAPLSGVLQRLDAAPALESTGAHRDTADDVVQRLRMGQRIEEITQLGGERAWLRIAGRKADGSTYSYSRMLRVSGDGWRIDPAPSAEAMAELPEGWPPPLATGEDFNTMFLAGWQDASIGDRPVLMLQVGGHFYVLD